VEEANIIKSTYYVRDASGNVMALYEKNPSVNSGTFTQTEVHLYGSSRLGIYKSNRDVENFTLSLSTSLVRGNKIFELTTHLGNVLVTVSDKKIGHTTDGTTIDYYNADMVTANDYYPGGMSLPGRKYQAGSNSYRYGFNGQEKWTMLLQVITPPNFGNMTVERVGVGT